MVPFFDAEMLPRLERGENLLLVAHGNSIRALMKHLEDIDEQEMATVEMHFGELVIYHFLRETKKPTKREVRKAGIVPPHA